MGFPLEAREAPHGRRKARNLGQVTKSTNPDTFTHTPPPKPGERRFLCPRRDEMSYLSDRFNEEILNYNSVDRMVNDEGESIDLNDVRLDAVEAFYQNLQSTTAAEDRALYEAILNDMDEDHVTTENAENATSAAQAFFGAN